MTDRFSLFPLAAHAWGSLRRRAAVGRERRDWPAILTLTMLPLSAAYISVRFGWTVQHSESLVAGFSLLAASLLAVVPQFAAWRQRLTDRDKRGEGVARRKIDEAVTHTLLGVVVSVGLAALAVVLTNTTTTTPQGTESMLWPWAEAGATAVIMAGGTYLVLTMILVVNLLFDAYQDANGLTAARNEHPEAWEDDQDVA